MSSQSVASVMSYGAMCTITMDIFRQSECIALRSEDFLWKLLGLRSAILFRDIDRLFEKSILQSPKERENMMHVGIVKQSTI